MKASKKIINKFLPKIIGLRLNALFRIKPEKALKKAYNIFSSPRKGKVKPEQEVFLNKAKTTSINLDSNSVQIYHWKGEGETVILVHGWDSNTHRWKDLVKDLQKEGFNIIAFDGPAHGYSEGDILNVPIYSKCLDRILKLYRAEYIIGHSVGAMTVVYNQYIKQSSFVKKIVLLGAPSEMSAIMSDYQKILRLNDKFMTALDQYFKDKFDYYFKEFSISEFSKNIETEALIIHDKFDRIAPVSAAESIHKNLKHSTLKITEGAGHSLNKEGIRKDILQFLKS